MLVRAKRNSVKHFLTSEINGAKSPLYLPIYVRVLTYLLFKVIVSLCQPVVKANLLAEMFARNSSLPDINQPLPVIDNVSSSMPQKFFLEHVELKRFFQISTLKNPLARMAYQHLS